MKVFKRLVITFTAFLMAVGLLSPMGLFTKVKAEGESATAELKAKKVLEGGTLEDGQFTFKIEAITADAPMPEKLEAKNDADGNISFGNATYTAAGTYEYKVTEVKGDDASITYDTKAKTLTVTVTESSSTGEVATPNNGTNYLPKKHDVSTSDNPVKVTYRHEGDLDGGYYSPKWVIYENGDEEHVFCGANYKSASSSDYGERTVWNADAQCFQAPATPLEMVNWSGLFSNTAMAEKYLRHLDRVAYLYSYDYHEYDGSNAGSAWSSSDDPEVMRGWALRDAIQKVMWNLYPYNAAGYTNVNDLRKTTQEAIFFILKCGQGYIDGKINKEENEFRNSSPDTKMFDDVIDYALKGTKNGKMKNYPDGTITYVYWNTVTSPDGKSSAITKEETGAQPLIGIYAPWQAPALTVECSEVEFVNTVGTTPSEEPSLKTTVTAGGKTASASAAAELTAAEAGSVTEVTDTIDYQNLTGGATYTVSGTLIEIETDAVVATASEEKVADESGSGKWDVTFTNVKLEAGKTYVVFEEAANKDNPEDRAEHKDKEDKSQTIVVTPETPDEGTITIVNTTVTANGVAATETAAATVAIKSGEKVTVTDKVELEGLDANTTYKLRSQLVNTYDGTVLDTQTQTLTGGPTSVEVTFKELDAAGTYTVVTTLLDETEATEIATHNGNFDVLSETVTVTVDTPTTSVRVVKVWNDPYGMVNDKTIDVNLLKDGAVVETVTLSSANGHTYTWENLDASSTYDVVESTIVPHTLPVVQRLNTDPYEFIITNYTRPWLPETPDEDTPNKFGYFSVKKTCSEGLSADKEFKFVATIDGKDYEFTLRKDETTFFDFIPAGTKVAVKETLEGGFKPTYKLDGTVVKEINFTVDDTTRNYQVEVNNEPVKNIPDTSDTFNQTLWGMLFGMSSLIALVIIIELRRYRNVTE